jgi:hypothetical protein
VSSKYSPEQLQQWAIQAINDINSGLMGPNVAEGLTRLAERTGLSRHDCILRIQFMAVFGGMEP